MTDKLKQSNLVVTKDQVQQVLAGDKGSDAHLKSWELIHFTKVGDNFGSTVVGIEVKYLLGDERKELEAFYVTKHIPQQQEGINRLMTRDLFVKEGQFYEKLLPELNGIMNDIGQP